MPAVPSHPKRHPLGNAGSCSTIVQASSRKESLRASLCPTCILNLLAQDSKYFGGIQLLSQSHPRLFTTALDNLLLPSLLTPPQWSGQISLSKWVLIGEFVPVTLWDFFFCMNQTELQCESHYFSCLHVSLLFNPVSQFTPFLQKVSTYWWALITYNNAQNSNMPSRNPSQATKRSYPHGSIIVHVNMSELNSSEMSTLSTRLCPTGLSRTWSVAQTTVEEI